MKTNGPTTKTINRLLISIDGGKKVSILLVILAPPKIDISYLSTSWSLVLDEDVEMDKEEQERLEDLKERDEFAERLKNKDKDGTKKVCHNSTRSQCPQLSS